MRLLIDAMSPRVMWSLALLALLPPASTTRPNILFIIADDLRPDLNCYYQGPDQPTATHPPIHSPNIDSLASRSTLFKRAYVQYALCAPSRTSFLTGRRPDSTKTYDFHFYWRNEVGNFTTLPQYFKDNGYETLGYGKVFHPGDSSGENDPISWTEMYSPDFDGDSFYSNGKENLWQAVPTSMANRKPLADETIANHAVAALRKLSTRTQTGHQPFFLAVGFRKPHMAFQYTEEFESLYKASDMPLPVNPNAPVNMPHLAWSTPGPILSYDNIERMHLKHGVNKSFPDHVTQSIRAGYYRSASFSDSMVGRVLDEIHEQGLDNSTIVTFIGDHGWHLGEQNIWRKKTNFEMALRAPMMIRVPGLTDHGQETSRLVEFVDLFPTLVDLAGLPPIPVCDTDNLHQLVCSEGVSLLPLLQDPQADFKGAAFSQVQRETHMGYTVRTNEFRYTEWLPDGADWEDVRIAELYDHVSDPNESWNRAYDAEYHGTRATLRQVLRQGWRAVVDKPLSAADDARRTWRF